MALLEAGSVEAILLMKMHLASFQCDGCSLQRKCINEIED